MPLDELAAAVVPLLAREGLSRLDAPADEWLKRLIALLRPRAKRLNDFVDLARPFLTERLSTKKRP